MKRLQISAVLLVSMILTACGFTLRGSQALPENLSTVVISSSVQYAPMVRTLVDRLPVYQLQGITPEQASYMTMPVGSVVSIKLYPEDLERRLLSMFSTGQVAEYELIYSVRYEVFFPGKRPITNTMTVAREYQEDPDRILAKSRELDLVMQQMRDESADRIIRLLSSQLTTAQDAADDA